MKPHLLATALALVLSGPNLAEAQTSPHQPAPPHVPVLTPQEQQALVDQSGTALPVPSLAPVDPHFSSLGGVLTFVVEYAGLDSATATYWWIRDYYGFDSTFSPVHFVRVNTSSQFQSATQTSTRMFFEFSPFSGAYSSKADGSFLEGHSLGTQRDQVWSSPAFSTMSAIYSGYVAGNYDVEDFEALADQYSTSTVTSIVKPPGATGWTTLAGDPEDNMGEYIQFLIGSSQESSDEEGFKECMSECFGSVSWVNALSFTACAGIGIGACLAGTGGAGAAVCIKPIVEVCVWVAMGAEGAGVLACLLKCIKEHL